MKFTVGEVYRDREGRTRKIVGVVEKANPFKRKETLRWIKWESAAGAQYLTHEGTFTAWAEQAELVPVEEVS